MKGTNKLQKIDDDDFVSIDEIGERDGIITLADLVQRVNLSLANSGRTLRVRAAEPGAVTRFDLGDDYDHTARINVPGEPVFDLEAYARELGVMRPDEVIDN